MQQVVLNVTRSSQRMAACAVDACSGRSGIHPLRSYALIDVTSVQTNSLNPRLWAAVTEPSLNAELGCIIVVDTFRLVLPLRPGGGIKPVSFCIND